MLSPEYESSKHHQPGDVGVKGGETALDVLLPVGVREIGPLDSSVSAVQGTGGVSLARGPHKLNVTVPVGAGPEALPVTTATSVVLCPSSNLYGFTVVLVVVVLPEVWMVSVSEPQAVWDAALFESPL